MKWVTWQDVAVDRIGCAWLIRKFIDAKAEFMFVPEGSTKLPQGAEPFDIPGKTEKNVFGGCGGDPGLSVVVASMMRDFVGPKENAAPHESAAINTTNDESDIAIVC